MRFVRKNSHVLIGAAVAAGMATLAGCLPPTGPTTPALYYQVTPQDSQEALWTKRLLPATGVTETVLESDSSEPRVIQSQQPGASNFIIAQNDPSAAFTRDFYVLLTGGPAAQLNLLFTQAGYDASPTGGVWSEWSPNGKNIGLQINNDILVASADGSTRETIATVDGDQSPSSVERAWSPNSSMIAYTRAANVLEVANIRTGAKTTFPAIGPIRSIQWLADNRHIAVSAGTQEEYRAFILDIRNASALPQGLTTNANLGAWSPDGDRAILQTRATDANPLVNYELVYADGRPSVPLLSAQHVQESANGYQHWPAFSSDGERLAYMKDIDNDGDADVVIANKNGTALQTFLDFGEVRDSGLSWSPDDSHLVVVTNKSIGAAASASRWLITFDGGVVTALADAANSGDNNYDAVVEWSPNSRHFVLGHKSAAGFNIVGGALFDTENLTNSGLSLNLPYKVAWSADSNNLAIVYAPLEEPNHCAAATMDMSDGSHTITPLSQITACNVYWGTAKAPQP